MRILFVSQTHLRKDLGASKVLIELAEELTNLGWDCDLKAAPDLVAGDPGPDQRLQASVEALDQYLKDHAAGYDVVDYEHTFLPFPRSRFDPRPLLVARSVLLHRDRGVNPIPKDRSLKARVRSLIHGPRDTRRHEAVLKSVRTSVQHAELVNVANYADQDQLVAWGIPKDKIVVVPYGLSQERQALFQTIATPDRPRRPIVAFVGTFDSRKGANDLPALVEQVTSRVPGSSFLLLGTYLQEHAVLERFPASLRARIRVTPTYDPKALPELLAECAVGVFPSYLESFGFGVLEMLAAGLPVFAYDVPGPPMMLPPAYLVPPGDVRGLGDKVVGLMSDPNQLATARVWAQERSRPFNWKDIAQTTNDIYRDRLERRTPAARA